MAEDRAALLIRAQLQALAAEPHCTAPLHRRRFKASVKAGRVKEVTAEARGLRLLFRQYQPKLA
jgi:hypothetical protein